MDIDVVLPWEIDYCKCGKIKVSHIKLCVDCIKIMRRRNKIDKLLNRINNE